VVERAAQSRKVYYWPLKDVSLQLCGGRAAITKRDARGDAPG